MDVAAPRRSAEAMAGDFCGRVKQLRGERGWSLEDLANASGVSRSMLSQIERNEANPTLAVTLRIARAFGISLADLLKMPGATSSVEVIRADDRTYHYRSDNHCQIRTLSPLNLEKDVEFYEVRLQPRALAAQQRALRRDARIPDRAERADPSGIGRRRGGTRTRRFRQLPRRRDPRHSQRGARGCGGVFGGYLSVRGYLRYARSGCHCGNLRWMKARSRLTSRYERLYVQRLQQPSITPNDSQETVCSQWSGSSKRCS